jgi:hypothetical protein
MRKAWGNLTHLKSSLGSSLSMSVRYDPWPRLMIDSVKRPRPLVTCLFPKAERLWLVSTSAAASEVDAKERLLYLSSSS